MHGVDYLLHAILDYIVDGYVPLIEDLEEEVLEMETTPSTASSSRDEVNRIFTLRRELIRFQRVLGPMGEVAQKLARQELPCIDAEARHYFRDVQDHIRRVADSGRRPARSADLVFELSTLLEQQRQGDHHPPAGGLGGDPGGTDRDRRHLRHELREYARAQPRYGYFIVVGGDRRHLPVALLAVPARALALGPCRLGRLLWLRRSDCRHQAPALPQLARHRHIETAGDVDRVLDPLFALITSAARWMCRVPVIGSKACNPRIAPLPGSVFNRNEDVV